MLKKLSLILILLFCLSAKAQDFSDSWKGYFSYTTIEHVAYGNDLIFAAAKNSIFAYDLVTDKTTEFSTIQGLMGEEISAIYYSQSINALFVGYVSGKFDVVREDENVLTVVDISNKQTILPQARRINHFMEYDGFVYISSGFGISLFDLARLEFDDSYFIGDAGESLTINQTAVVGDYIYAATAANGIRRALVQNDDLIDFANWSQVAGGSWYGVANLNEQLYAINTSNQLQRYDGNTFVSVASFSGSYRDFMPFGESLTITFNNTVYIFNASGSQIASVPVLPEYDATYNTGIAVNETIYLGTNDNGLLISSTTNPTQALQVVPDGPLRNDPFNIEAHPGGLYVVYGDYSNTYNPFPLKRRGLSHLHIDSTWVNISYDEALQANNLTNITIDPEDNDHVFVSSYNSGLLEIQDDVPVALSDETNSGLSDIQINPTDVRINAAAYDRDGNLWMTNSLVDNGIARKSGGNIQGIDVSDILDGPATNYSSLVVDRAGNVFFGTHNYGLAAYNPSSGAFVLLTEEGNNLPSKRIRSLAIDNNGVLWIGTELGLRLLYGPAQVFDNPDVQTQPIIILQDGLAAELLNEQFIYHIEVDGSNNKWIGTLNSGAFYFSSSGQETLAQFDQSNSPLPSNNVQDISIDSESGEVYFATPLGLVSFSGTAVDPSDDLEQVRAYPNPVRPDFRGNVIIDGLTARANVKITDITGNLVHEEVAVGGSIQWDTIAFGKYRVASGVYLILVTSSDASETKVAKLMIIR